MSKSNISKYLRGESFPDWAWVDAFITACLSRYRLKPEKVKAERDIWLAAWKQAERQRSTPPPDATKPAEPENLQDASQQDENSPAPMTEAQEALPPPSQGKSGTRRINWAPVRYWLKEIGVLAIGVLFVVLIVGGGLYLIFGNTLITLTVTPPGGNQSTTKPLTSAVTTPEATPPMSIPRATSTAPPREATANLSAGMSFDLDNPRTFPEVNGQGADLAVAGSSNNLAAVSPGSYLAILPNTVEPKRSSCENTGAVTAWTNTIANKKLTTGTHVCAFTSEKRLALIIVEEKTGQEVRFRYFVWEN